MNIVHKGKIKAVSVIFFIALGYWIIDSFISLITYEYNLRSLLFSSPITFMDPFILKIPVYQLISRLLITFMICLSGCLVIKYTKRIRETSRKLQAMFDAAPIGIGLIDENRIIKEVNTHIKELLGYTNGELENQSARILYPSDEEYERVGKIKHPLVQKYGIGSVETFFKRKNGEILDILLSSSKIQTTNNLIFTAQDISDRKKAEQDLKTSAQIFESVPSGIFIYDCSKIEEGDQSIILVDGNPAAEFLTGVELDDVIGKSFDELWPNAKDLTTQLVHKCIQGGLTYEDNAYHYHDDNLDGIFRLKSFCIPNHRIAIVFEDITESYNATQALKDSENVFRTAFETIPDAVAINRKRDGKYLHVNDGYLLMSGYSAHELEGKTSIEVGLWGSEEMRDKLVSRLKETGKVSDYELQFVRKDGEVRDGLMSAALIIIDKEECTLTITKDITTRKEREEELFEKEKQIRKAAKMEAVGTLAGGVAHDFNNIIQIISGNVQLLLTSEESKDIHHKLGVIYEATVRGADLSRRLLTFSRNVESKLQPTDINSEIKLAHKLLDRSIAGPVMINVGLDLDKDLKYAIADPTQLNQIITNLCINAKDAMPKGGHLTITTRNVELDALYCKPYDDVIPGKYVRISISDDGEGMPQEVQERIFEPFFTTKEPGKGTGLGLAVVYGIIKNHHGHITVYSAPGRGTEFKIFIPTSNDEENAKNEIEPLDIPLIGGTETILIIDDEEAIKAIGKEILERHGYNVIDVDRGEEGLKIYKKNKIDLVLLDLIMPGMSGTRVLKELMKIDPNAKVIVASGYSANGPIRDALGEGAKQFIDKPYTLRQLVTTIRDVLDDKGDLL
jgi:PAS domain S-box-containing protein